MLCTHELGPKYKMQTVCTFQMNWATRSNNKISLCRGDSEMAIIQHHSVIFASRESHKLCIQIIAFFPSILGYNAYFIKSVKY